jgi:hypothetical protein
MKPTVLYRSATKNAPYSNSLECPTSLIHTSRSPMQCPPTDRLHRLNACIRGKFYAFITPMKYVHSKACDVRGHTHLNTFCPKPSVVGEAATSCHSRESHNENRCKSGSNLVLLVPYKRLFSQEEPSLSLSICHKC